MMIFVIAIVLILVLMEDTLRVVIERCLMQLTGGLNPCFNGRYSQRRTGRIVRADGGVS